MHCRCLMYVWETRPSDATADGGHAGKKLDGRALSVHSVLTVLLKYTLTQLQTLTLARTHTHIDAHTLSDMCPCFHSFVSNQWSHLSIRQFVMCMCANSCLPSSLVLCVSACCTHTRLHTLTHTLYDRPLSNTDIPPTRLPFLGYYRTICPSILPTITYTGTHKYSDIYTHAHILASLCVLIPCRRRLWASWGWQCLWEIPSGGQEQQPLPRGLVWSSLVFRLLSLFSADPKPSFFLSSFLSHQQ